MKMRNKIIVLSLALAGVWGGIELYSSNAYARVCFLVGGCRNPVTGKFENNVDLTNIEDRDCASLGYRVKASSCTSAQEPIDTSSCTKSGETYIRGCKCKTEYKYLADATMDSSESGSAKYIGKEKCTDTTGDHFEYKVCKTKYKYIVGGSSGGYHSGSSATAVLTEHHNRDLTSCVGAAIGGGDSCVDKYDTNTISVDPDDIYTDQSLNGTNSITKYTQCVCPAEYKYLAKDIEDPFVGDGESCFPTYAEQDKRAYKSVVCTDEVQPGDAYYKKTCGSNEYYETVDDKTYLDVTCHLCKPDNCTRYTGYDENEERYVTYFDNQSDCKYVGSSTYNTAPRYACKVVVKGGKTCYRLAERNCTEAAIIDYYGYNGEGGFVTASGDYYQPENMNPMFIPYYETEEECLSGLGSGQVCARKQIWPVAYGYWDHAGGTYYGSGDRYCYYRKTCQTEGMFDNLSDCMNMGRSEFLNHNLCKLVSQDGLTCYRRVPKTCNDQAQFDYYGRDGIDGVTYEGYYNTNSTYIQYYDTEEACLSGIGSNQTCKSLEMWGDPYYMNHGANLCYYRETTSSGGGSGGSSNGSSGYYSSGSSGYYSGGCNSQISVRFSGGSYINRSVTCSNGSASLEGYDTYTCPNTSQTSISINVTCSGTGGCPIHVQGTNASTSSSYGYVSISNPCGEYVVTQSY